MPEANELVDELLDRWQEAARQGQLLSPAELCQDCPELQALVEDGIRLLRQMEHLQEAVAVEGEPTTHGPLLAHPRGTADRRASCPACGTGRRESCDAPGAGLRDSRCPRPRRH